MPHLLCEPQEYSEIREALTAAVRLSVEGFIDRHPEFSQLDMSCASREYLDMFVQHILLEDAEPCKMSKAA